MTIRLRSLNGGVCHSCNSGEICLDGVCYERCQIDDDCAEGQACIDCVCTAVETPPVICGEINKAAIDYYVQQCRISGTCDIDRYFAFTSLDLISYGANEIKEGDSGSNGFVQSPSIYCCQEGKNCEDGFIGCEPDCDSCCDVDDCLASISFSYREVFICVDSSCIRTLVIVPYQHISGSSHQYLDMDNVDFTQSSYSCNYLKSQRNVTVSDSSSCQQESGKNDTDFACMFRIADFNSTDADCPTNCPY